MVDRRYIALPASLPRERDGRQMRRYQAMRGIRWRTIGVMALSALLISGCQTAGTRRPSTVVSPSASVSDAGDADAVGERTISATPVQSVTFRDRHPLFYKPREYWQTSGDNKVVKAAAATFIGVPAGVVGEVKQIITGSPPPPRY
jgi:hypothetical protein